MPLSEIIALASLASALIGIGTNVGLYIHLSSTVNTRFESVERKMDTRFDLFERKMDSRFESVERRLELIQGDTHQTDIRLTKLELKKG